MLRNKKKRYKFLRELRKLLKKHRANISLSSYFANDPRLGDFYIAIDWIEINDKYPNPIKYSRGFNRIDKENLKTMLKEKHDQ
jgi:hypothetical protein